MQLAIITLFDRYETNYGNKFQNYAAERIYSKLGFKVVSLIKERPFTKREIVTLQVKRMINFLAGFRLSTDHMRWIRWTKFWEYDRKRLHLCYLRSLTELSQTKYDFYSVGSDQVWKPCVLNSRDDEDWFFLRNIQQSKRISMAPSFGVSEIPIEKTKAFINGLNGFRNISVREDVGRALVKQLTGKDAEVLCDPTLALEKSEWDAIQRKPIRINDKEEFCLCYFLGELAKDKLDYLTKFAKKNNWKLFNLMDDRSYLYTIDPEEFIWLINHTQVVFTDSFHGCVFSIIYRRPFFVFRREGKNNDMFSRIETLLGKFHLEDRIMENVSEIEGIHLYPDYSGAEDVICDERGRFMSFIMRETTSVTDI